MKKKAYQIRIIIEEFEYDPKIGTYMREVLREIPASKEARHADWGLGDFEILEDADECIEKIIHTDIVPSRCNCK